MPTKIEWAQETWNPIVGCSKCSSGCENCYAESMAARLSGIAVQVSAAGNGKIKPDDIEAFGKYHRVTNCHGHWNGEIAFADDVSKLSCLVKPRKIFVCSMGDLFYPMVPFTEVKKILEIQLRFPHHTFIWLTKRPHRMVEFFRWYASPDHIDNLWVGTSICVQGELDKMFHVRNPIIPAAVRFISFEPLLSEMNFSDNLIWDKKMSNVIDWIIVGGESRASGRPMHPNWARGIRDTCEEKGIPFLFKQWGEWVPAAEPHGLAAGKILDEHEVLYYYDDGSFAPIGEGHRPGKLMHKVGKNYSGRFLDGVIHDNYPILER